MKGSTADRQPAGTLPNSSHRPLQPRWTDLGGSRTAQEQEEPTFHWPQKPRCNSHPSGHKQLGRGAGPNPAAHPGSDQQRQWQTERSAKAGLALPRPPQLRKIRKGRPRSQQTTAPRWPTAHAHAHASVLPSAPAAQSTTGTIWPRPENTYSCPFTEKNRPIQDTFYT